MALSKKRKVDRENSFQPRMDRLIHVHSSHWQHKIRLSHMLRDSGTHKKCQRETRYETKHNGFQQTYPLKSELRSQKISSLRTQYEQSNRILTDSFTAQQRANECSLRAFWVNTKSHLLMEGLSRYA